MKKVSILVFFVLFTGLFMGSVYAGITIEEKSIHPQPEQSGIFDAIRPANSIILLSDGSKLMFVQNGAIKQVYLIQKNGTRELANGTFMLPNGKQLTLNKGIILQSR
jgi:hypothetical protein